MANNYKKIYTPLALILLLILASALAASKILAQVASGDIKILDISIDLGGGSLKSGNIVLKNTSIGQVASGNFVTSGNTTLCAGHACKNDYTYDPGTQPTLQQLIISAAQDGVAKGRYGTSGLRDDDEGGNYYNALSIQPQFSGVADNIELAGAAFTENNTNFTTSPNPFPSLLASADASKGFVVIYANKDKNMPNGPPVKRVFCDFNFCAGFYYVYLDGRWDGPLEVRNIPWSTMDKLGFPQDRIISAADELLRDSPVGHIPPTKLAFKAYFKKELGNYTWGTFGFAFTSTSLSGSITNATPVPSAIPLPQNLLNASSISSSSTFYLFSLF